MKNGVLSYFFVVLWHQGLANIALSLNEQYPCSVPNCVQCDSTNSSVCTDCSQFYALYEGWCYWCPQTPHTTNISSCPLCKPSCINCDMYSGECLSCIPGYQLQLLDNDQTDCLRCKVDNCAECNTTDSCQDCLQGYALMDGKCTKCQVEGCVNCDSDPSRCDDCGDGFTYSGRQNICRSVNVQCSVGQYYSIDDRKCPACMDGCLQCPNENSCYQCAPGYYQPLLDKTTLYQDCYKCSDNCQECQFNSQYCTGCPDGQTPFEGLCFVSCERNRTSEFCRSGIDTQLQVTGKGYGSRYLSPIHDINFVFTIRTTSQSDRLDLEDVNCSLNLRKSLSQGATNAESQELKFDHTPLRISAYSSYTQSVLFNSSQLAGDQVVNLTCISYFLDNHLGFTMRDTVVFRTIPSSSGQFRVKQVGDNQFLITVDGFDPKIPGLAEKVHLNFFRLDVSQKCNIDPMRPYNYIQAPIWEFSSNDYVYSKKYSYTSRVTNDTCVQFTLTVSNDFVQQQVFHSRIFNVSPMGNDASIEYYIEKLQQQTDGAQMQKLYEGVETKIILSASDYCEQGTLNATDQTCKCRGVQPNMMYNKIQKNIIDLMTATKKFYHREQDPIKLYETITNLLAYLTNNTCSIQDSTFIQEVQLFMARFMNISANHISQKTSINLILININIYQGLTAQQNNRSRILQRLQIQENILETLPTLGDLESKIYQDIWKSIEIASSKFNQLNLLHGGFRISTRFLEYNKPIEFSIMLNSHISIRVPNFALSSLFRLGKDQYTFACLVGYQLPYQRTQGLQLYENQFVEPQFFSQRRGQLYPQTDSRFLLSISFYGRQLTGFETCFMYLDSKWTTSQIKSSGKKGQVSCVFTNPNPVGLNIILPAPISELQRRQNQSVGLVNLIIMSLLFLVFAGYAFKVSEPPVQKEPQRESIKNFDDDEKQAPKPKLQRRPSIELYFPEAQHTLKKEELQVNHGPVIIEYEGQSQQKIITKPEENKSAFSNCVCNLTSQQGTRVALIFLWITQYQWIFVAFLNSPTFKDNNVQIFFQLSIITLIMSNFVNYLYASIVYVFYRILNRNKKTINISVTILFIMNLIFVLVICSQTDHEDLAIYHACNIIFQIFFNMGLFDCYSEFLSQKLNCLEALRKFKVLNFN